MTNVPIKRGTAFSVGEDGQTIHQDGGMVAMGCSPEAARRLVERLNSEPARQEDVDLLLWLLAEARNTIDWYHRIGEMHLRHQDELLEERDAARVDAAFWSSINGGAK